MPDLAAVQHADLTQQKLHLLTVRVRVEHVFGAHANEMGGTLVRTIGLVGAKAKIGMKNLAENMRQLGQLRRINPCPA